MTSTEWGRKAETSQWGARAGFGHPCVHKSYRCSLTNAQHTCPPGCWFDLLTRSGWSVGISTAPVAKFDAPCWPGLTPGWVGVRGTPQGSGALSPIPHAQLLLSLPQQRWGWTNHFYLWQNISRRRSNCWGREVKVQLVPMCWLTPAQDLARSVLFNIFYLLGKKELFVLIAAWHQE